MDLKRFMLLCFITVGLFLTGCAGKEAEEKKPEEIPAETLYQKAQARMEAEAYQEAASLFEEVERQYPYSQYATKAELMAAYALYKDLKYDEAILALERFIELHPGNEDVEYAYYLKALSFYEQMTDVARDQAMTELALEAFNTLIRRFPESDYARDASYKRDLALDHLAGKEMEIGRYYLKRNQINAAINRFRTVVTDYQTTTHVPEALHRLVESYLTLGLRQEAVQVASVLGHNYPGSVWYQDSYELLTAAERGQVEDHRSWLDRTVDSLFATE